MWFSIVLPILGNLVVSTDPGAIIHKALAERNLFGQTPLHRMQAENKIRRLIARGADIQARDDWGNTPLHEAARRGNLKLVQFLIHTGAKSTEQNAFGETPLHVAAKNGKADVIEVLLDRGSWIHDTNFWGQTPLHYAVAQNRIEVVKILLTRGADPKRKSANGKSALDLARSHTDQELFQWLQFQMVP
jgi:ankyrin repeat protein